MRQAKGQQFMTGPLPNIRHEAFAQALASGLAADAAYTEAGYRPNRGNAARMKSNESIRARVAELVDAAAERAVVDIQRVLNEYARIAFTGMSKFLRVSKDGDPIIDLSKCTPEDLDLLAEATLEDFTEGRGEGRRDVRRVKIKMQDKMAALGRHLGLGERAREKTVDRLAQAIAEINARGSAAPIATLARLRSEGDRADFDPLKVG